MIIISSSLMGHGTFQAKYIPLSKSNKVSKIYVLRKYRGPDIDKVEYIVLPKLLRISFLNILITPFLLIYYALRKKADVILTYHLVPHAFFGFIASVCTGKPHVFCQTGGESESLAKKQGIKQIIKLILKQTLFINVPGEQSRNFWINFGVDKEKIIVLHSSIDTEKYQPNEINRYTEFDFVFIGILNKRKRINEIIEIFGELCNKYPKAKLQIIGKGPLEKVLQEKVKDLALEKNVIFQGYQKEVKPYLLNSKIFLMFSEMEGLPVALMEAMAVEKLCISTNVNNIPTVLQDGKTGFSIMVDDRKMLFNKMMFAYENYDSLRQIRINARRIILENYPYDSVVITWSKIFNKLN